MACLMAGAGMVGIFTPCQLSSGFSFRSQSSGLLGTYTPVSVAPKCRVLRAGESELHHKVSPFTDRCLKFGSDVIITGEPSDKSLEVMRKFSEQYARKSETFFCVDKGVTAVVVKGLAEHKDTLGAPLCPCRHYDDKVAEVQQGFWNCPCVPMRERKECHCMLFLTPDNDFAGQEQKLSLDEITDFTKNA